MNPRNAKTKIITKKTPMCGGEGRGATTPTRNHYLATEYDKLGAQLMVELFIEHLRKNKAIS